MKKKSIRFKITLLCIAIFVIYNLLWFLNIIFVYYPLTENIPKQESGVYMYEDKETNFIYNVKKPDYLYFTGNLGVSDNDDSGLIIWPGFFGQNYTYGIILKDDGHVYNFNVDKSLMPLTSNKKEEEIINKNKKKIEALWNGAKNIWDISPKS